MTTRKPIVITGIDPSSTKMATVSTRPDDPTIDMRTEKLNGGQPNWPSSCAATFRLMDAIAADYPGHQMFVAMERPTVTPKGGARSVIPQAVVAGAVLTWCGMHNVPFVYVSPGEWKKIVTGNGSATKTQVAAHVLEAWPNFWHNCPKVTVKGNLMKDQDLLDAACINRFAEAKYLSITRKKRLS